MTIKTSYRVALIRWANKSGGIGQAIHQELLNLGHRPRYFDHDAPPAEEIDAVLIFGPFGKFLKTARFYGEMPVQHRPVLAFWNTEGLPDLRIPWPLMRSLSLGRSWVGRLAEEGGFQAAAPGLRAPLAALDARLHRFRYLGDFLTAHRRGWIDVFADISAIYARLLGRHGLPALTAHFGGFQGWYADLGLERDIDVLWMGKRATRRRSALLDRIREELRRCGVEMHVVDNHENPFVFGQARTRLLNRSQITLNLLRTWYDENSLRICMAAPNRSLVVSEPLLPHVPHYVAGAHYVSAPIEQLAQTIVHYLDNEPERLRIVENAYQLVTTTLTMGDSIARIMRAVERARPSVPIVPAAPATVR